MQNERWKMNVRSNKEVQAPTTYYFIKNGQMIQCSISRCMTLTGLATTNTLATKISIVMPLVKVGTALQTVEHMHVARDNDRACASVRES